MMQKCFETGNRFFSINVQTIYNTHLNILNIVARWPGSNHNVNIFLYSAYKQCFDNKEFKNCIFVADIGYAVLYQHAYVTTI